MEANAGYVAELPPSKVVSVAVSASSVMSSPEPSGGDQIAFHCIALYNILKYFVSIC